MKKPFLALLIVAVILFCVLDVSADWATSKSFLGRVIGIGAFLIKTVAKALFAVVNFVANKIVEFIAFLLSPAIEMIFSLITAFMQMNPRVYPLYPAAGCASPPPAGDLACQANPTVSAIIRSMLALMVPFYGILTVLIAVYIIYVSVSPSDRALAKAQFNKLMMSMFLVSISPPLFQLLMDIQLDMTTSILESANTYWSDAMVRGVTVALGSSILLGWWPIGIGLTGLMILGFRYVIIQILAIFFPLAFLLFFFEFTRGIGGNLLRTTIMWIFMPTAQALVLAVTVIAVSPDGPVQNSYAQGLVVLAGLVGFTVAGLMITGLLKWVGGLAAFAGASKPGSAMGAVLTGAGQIAMGMGSDALPASVAQLAYYRAGQTKPGVSNLGNKVRAGVGGFFSPLGNIGRGASEGYSRGGVLGAVGGVVRGTGGAFKEGFGRSARGVWPTARETAMDMNPSGRRYPQHPNKLGGGAPGGGGRGGGGGNVTPGGTASDISSMSTPTPPIGPKSSSYDGGRPAADRYSQLEAGSQRTLIGEHTGYPQVWWDEHVGKWAVNMGDVRAAADRGSGRGLSGMSLVAYGLERGFTPGGSRLEAAGAIVRGVMGLGFSLMPISPFEPIRQIGAFVVGVSSQMLPPGFRTVGYYVGSKMMGLGMRQCWGRSSGRNIVHRNAATVQRLDGEIANLDQQIQAAGGIQNAPQALLNRRNEVQGRRDRHWARVTAVLDGAREGSGVLGEKDNNFYQEMLTHLENNYSHDDQRRDLFRSYMTGTVNDEGSKSHPGNGLVGGLHQRMQHLVQGGMTQQAAWQQVFQDTVVTMNEDDFKAHIAGRIKSGTLTREHAQELTQQRSALLTHFRAQRVGFETRQVIPMTDREAAQDGAIHVVGGKYEAPKPAVTVEKANDTAWAEMADYASRAFSADGLRAYVELNARERAAAQHMEQFVDPVSGVRTLAIDIERTESGAWLVDQGDYSYIKQRASLEGDATREGYIRPVFKGKLEDQIQEHEREGRFQDALNLVNQNVGDHTKFATDTEGNYLVRNYTGGGRRIRGADADRDTAFNDFFGELRAHTRRDTAEGALYHTINPEGGRNARIRLTNWQGQAFHYDDTSISQRGGVWGIEVEGDEVRARAAHLRAEADQLRTQGNAAQAAVLDARAAQVEGRGNFMSLQDYLHEGRTQAGDYVYGGTFTPSSAKVLHFENAADAGTYVQGMSQQGATFLSGAGIADEQYQMGAQVTVWDPTTMQMTQRHVDQAFLDWRQQQLETMRDRGVYLQDEEAEAVVQQLGARGYSSQQINDFFVQYGEHIQNMPECMRPNAIKLEFSEGATSPYAIEKTTGTFIVNMGSDGVLEHLEGNGNVLSGLGHEGFHVLLDQELARPGAQNVIVSAGEEYAALMSEHRTGWVQRKYTEQLSSQGLVDGLQEAVDAGRQYLEASGHTEVEKGRAMTEVIATRAELSRLEQAYQTAQQTGGNVAAAQQAIEDYVGTMARAYDDAVQSYSQTAAQAQLNPQTAGLAIPGAANIAQIRAMSEHLEGVLANYGVGAGNATYDRLQELNGTQARAQGMVDIDGALAQAGVVGGAQRRHFDNLYQGLADMADATVIDPATGLPIAAIRPGERVV